LRRKVSYCVEENPSVFYSVSWKIRREKNTLPEKNLELLRKIHPFYGKLLESKNIEPADRSPPRRMQPVNFPEKKSADISLENLVSRVVHS